MVPLLLIEDIMISNRDHPAPPSAGAPKTIKQPRHKENRKLTKKLQKQSKMLQNNPEIGQNT